MPTNRAQKAVQHLKCPIFWGKGETISASFRLCSSYLALCKAAAVDKIYVKAKRPY